MRRTRRKIRCMPLLAGLAAGYAATLLTAAALALLLSLTDFAAEWAGAASLLSVAVGSFLCGRIAGIMRRHQGLNTGLLCGAVFFVPLLIIALISGTAGGAMLPVKAGLCLAFSAAGGVSGVNSLQK